MKNLIRKIIDVLMYILAILLMAFPYFEPQTHEYIGVIITICFIIHNLLNWKWYKSILKGKKSLKRTMQTSINVVLFVFMIMTILSGFLMSTIFHSITSVFNTALTARQIHMFSSHWFYILFSLHIGLHLTAILNQLKKHIKLNNKQIKLLFSILLSIVMILGIIYFIQNKIIGYLFFLNEFVFFDNNKPLHIFIFEYNIICLLFVLISFYISKLLSKNFKLKK